MATNMPPATTPQSPVWAGSVASTVAKKKPDNRLISLMVKRPNGYIKRFVVITYPTTVSIFYKVYSWIFFLNFILSKYIKNKKRKMYRHNINYKIKYKKYTLF